MVLSKGVDQGARRAAVISCQPRGAFGSAVAAPGETALVLGSFRRRAGGDWDFVPGGKGYEGEGGLVELVQEYGIEVD